MCQSETCPCRTSDCVALIETFVDLWETNYTVQEEAAIYKDPVIKKRLDELGWEVQ